MSWRRYANPNGQGRPCAVYRLYDESRRLLYVGVSYDPERRIQEHTDPWNGKPWRLEIDEVEVEWFQQRDTAEAAENVAIWEENPLYNIARPLPHNGRAPVP